MKTNLSIRMKMNASLVEDGERVADIGCDHGYVAIWLAQEKHCPMVIATDINEGPLRRAKKNIDAAKVIDHVETRLGDGLEPIMPDEIDTVIMAGMGGMKICEILSAGSERLGFPKLILQPQSDIEAVRRHLHRLGYKIDRESVCMEDGKYYFAIRALKGAEDRPYTDAEYRHSRLLAEEGGSVYRAYIRQLLDKAEGLLSALDSPEIEQDEQILRRKGELKEDIAQMRENLKH